MSLDEKDIQTIADVVDKLITARLEAAKPVKKPRKPYTRKPKITPVDTGIDFEVEHEQLAREEIENPPEKIKPTIVKLRTKVVDENGDIRRGSEASKGRHTIQARVEPFTVHKRPNLFQDPKSWVGAAAKEYERSGEAKKDKRLDKVLIGDNEPVQRRGEAVQAEVECVKCGRTSIISMDCIYPDPETQEVHYICDNCIRNR